MKCYTPNVKYSEEAIDTNLQLHKKTDSYTKTAKLIRKSNCGRKKTTQQLENF